MYEDTEAQKAKNSPKFAQLLAMPLAVHYIKNIVSLWGKHETSLFPIIKYPGSLRLLMFSNNITTGYAVVTWPSLYHSVGTGVQETD